MYVLFQPLQIKVFCKGVVIFACDCFFLLYSFNSWTYLHTQIASLRTFEWSTISTAIMMTNLCDRLLEMSNVQWIGHYPLYWSVLFSGLSHSNPGVVWSAGHCDWPWFSEQCSGVWVLGNAQVHVKMMKACDCTGAWVRCRAQVYVWTMWVLRCMWGTRECSGVCEEHVSAQVCERTMKACDCEDDEGLCCIRLRATDVHARNTLIVCVEWRKLHVWAGVWAGEDAITCTCYAQ